MGNSIAKVVFCLLLALCLVGGNRPVYYMTGGSGASTFCGAAPENKYCMDFENPGTSCTAESPPFDGGTPASCGDTTGTAMGGSEWMLVTGTDAHLNASAWTHNDETCAELMFQMDTKAVGGAQSFFRYIEADDTHTSPTLNHNLSDDLRFFCDGGTPTGTFTPTLDVNYQIRFEFKNSTGVGQYWVDDVFQGSCDGPGTNNDDGLKIYTGNSLVFRVDNIIIKDGLCP